MKLLTVPENCPTPEEMPEVATGLLPELLEMWGIGDEGRQVALLVLVEGLTITAAGERIGITKQSADRRLGVVQHNLAEAIVDAYMIIDDATDSRLAILAYLHRQIHLPRRRNQPD